MALLGVKGLKESSKTSTNVCGAFYCTCKHFEALSDKRKPQRGYLTIRPAAHKGYGLITY